mmetsp:Transcript_96602/g.273185  ORF Transcript_96602/g.273185 Transcript_96602/m.273185 type:complete len:127 (+) Transcript_96602:989-1369(+)
MWALRFSVSSLTGTVLQGLRMLAFDTGVRQPCTLVLDRAVIQQDARNWSVCGRRCEDSIPGHRATLSPRGTPRWLQGPAGRSSGCIEFKAPSCCLALPWQVHNFVRKFIVHLSTWTPRHTYEHLGP